MPWSASLLAGYGFNDAEQFGFGVRGGYTLPMHVYVGATFVYHLGTSERTAVSTNLFYPGVEGATSSRPGPFLVRPYIPGSGPCS